MDVVILVAAMLVVGLLIGWFADKIFKGDRPKGLQGDLVAAVLTTLVVGLLDWYVIPMMNFSDTLKLLGVALEPALGALLVLWLMRRSN
ncbi:MAG TPA: hypothetical protein DCY42_00430 [Chloroflexi bacterium]|nr:hypothetical protein [Chloroflexota bacterium]